MAEIKVLDLVGLGTYDAESKKTMDTKDAEILKQSKEYADGLGVNYDPAGTAYTKVDELAKGQVATNTNDISELKNDKADKATTLEGYGIGNAYTKEETANLVTTEIGKAGHLKREIVDQLPDSENADPHTIYMVPKSGKLANNEYDEYMLVEKEGSKTLEKIGDSAVDLTDYATKTEVSTAKQEAIDTASADSTSKANKALNDAKVYADGLAPNYATADQGKKADTALQQVNITTGTSNGTISVGGSDVAVTGLGSAAYTDSTSYEQAGAVDALANGQVTMNKNDIEKLKNDIDGIKATTYVTITEEEIKALFA